MSLIPVRGDIAASAEPPPEADVCVIVEGCYPFISGGVSTWLDWLMRSQPEVRFSVVAIVADMAPRTVRYAAPPNLVSLQTLALHPPVSRDAATPSAGSVQSADLANALLALVGPGGGFSAFSQLLEVIKSGGRMPTVSELKLSEASWAAIRAMYARLMPAASFLHFFWAWQALFGGLFAVLLAPLPKARVYHAVSTGYAGLLAARAVAETRQPAILTEHGIYTNERRIEILMADWITDTVQKAIMPDEARMDLRDLWMQAFAAFSRTCYEAMTTVTTLYGDNQRLQVAHGAAPHKLEVIANGIDTAKFSGLSSASARDRPTIALIGRVVPIKDVKSYITAAALLRREIPDLEALILGPCDEDPAYYDECAALIRSLELEDCVSFLGSVNIVDHLPRIHVAVLTSLSEAQPLVLLEAGAAGIPCVATDVGACREILEGAASDAVPLGRGGFVTSLVAPAEIAQATKELLLDETLRRRMGEALRRRVHRDYDTAIASRAYQALYARHGVGAPACDIRHITEEACA